MILTKELAFLKAKEEFQKMIELAQQAANKGVQGFFRTFVIGLSLVSG